MKDSTPDTTDLDAELAEAKTQLAAAQAECKRLHNLAASLEVTVRTLAAMTPGAALVP